MAGKSSMGFLSVHRSLVNECSGYPQNSRPIPVYEAERRQQIRFPIGVADKSVNTFNVRRSPSGNCKTPHVAQDSLEFGTEIFNALLDSEFAVEVKPEGFAGDPSKEMHQPRFLLRQ